jgi:hypothetical protein
MIKHTPGPWKKNEGTSRFHITAPRSENGNRYICSLLDDAIGEQDTNLITLAPTAPHECDDPKCPGNVNRMKLELLDKIIAETGILPFQNAFMGGYIAKSRSHRKRSQMKFKWNGHYTKRGCPSKSWALRDEVNKVCANCGERNGEHSGDSDDCPSAEARKWLRKQRKEGKLKCSADAAQS